MYLKNRLGFCRVALETGASLVPIYSFGENDIYNDSFRHVYSQFNDFRRLKFSVAGVKSFAPYVFKVALAFLACLVYLTFVVPKKRAINTVVGPPIHVTKCEAPSEEQIAQLHHTYCTELTRLFDENKAKYYAKTARLEII